MSMRVWIEKKKTIWRRKLSWALICLFIAQSLIPAAALPAMAAEGNGVDLELEKCASPADLFEDIHVSLAGDTVQGSQIDVAWSITFDQEKLQNYMDANFNEGAELPEVSFHFKVDCEKLADSFRTQDIDIIGKVDSTERKIGTMTVKREKSGKALAVTAGFIKTEVFVEPIVIYAEGQLEVQLQAVQDGDKAQLESVKEDELKLEIDSEGGGSSQKGRYELEKRGAASGSSLTYELTAKAFSKEDIASAGSAGRGREAYIDSSRLLELLDDDTTSLEEWQELVDELEADSDDYGRIKVSGLSRKIRRNLDPSMIFYADETEGKAATAGSADTEAGAVGSASVAAAGRNPLPASRSSESEQGESYDLSGKTILDPIPSGLQVDHLYLGTGAGRVELVPASDYIESRKDGQTVIVPIASASDAYPDAPWLTRSADGRITQASVTIETSLTEEAMAAYMGRDHTWRFANTASLKEDTGSSELAQGTANNEITIHFGFSKSGKEADAGGRRLSWSLKLEAYLRPVYDAYIIDWVKADQTEYEADSFEILYENGRSAALNLDGSLPQRAIEADTAPNEYFRTEAGKNSIASMSELGNGSAGNTDGFYFTYKDRSKSPIETYHAFAIPCVKFLGQKIEIKYDTAISDQSGEGQKTDGTGRIYNDAMFIYRMQQGEGPGDWLEKVEFGRNVEYDHSLVRKTFGGYAPATQIATWNFEINRAGMEVKDLLITDTFDKNIQVIQVRETDSPPHSDSPFWKFEKGDRTNPNGSFSNVTVPEKNAGSGGKITYEWKDGERATSSELTIYVPEVEEDDYYRYTIQTRVVDPDLFAGKTAGNQNCVSNQAEYTYKVGDKDGEGHTAAVTDPILINLLTKEAVGAYGKDTNLVTWRVTANRDLNLYLKDICIWDELPAGVIFDPDRCDIQSVKVTERPEREGAFGSPKQYKLGEESGGSDGGKLARRDISEWPASGSDLLEKPDVSDSEPVCWYQLGDSGIAVSVRARGTDTEADKGYSKNRELFFVFYRQSADGGYVRYEGEQSFEITFTAYTEEPYRRYEFLSNQDCFLKNTAHLEGYVKAGPEGKEAELHSTAAASILVPKPFIKTAEAHHAVSYDRNAPYEGMPWIEWKLVMNQTGDDYTGAIVEDLIDDYMELDPDSMRFYIESGENGPGQVSGLTDPEEYFEIEKDAGHFKIFYPDGVKNLNSAYVNRPITLKFNTILMSSAPNGKAGNTVKIRIPKLKEDSADHSQSNVAQMNASAYGKMIWLKRLTITKYSSNAGDSGKGVLPGARFKLTPVLRWDKNANQWVIPQPAYPAEHTSDENGELNFARLRSDYIYKLEETEAAPGYANNFAPCYYVFREAAWEESTLPKAELKGAVTIWDADPKAPEVENNQKAITVSNSPQPELPGGSFTFRKTVEGSQRPLPGVRFEMTSKDGSYRMEAVSDEDGMVTFQFDPADAEYELKEIETPESFQPAAGFLKVNVTFHSDTSDFTVETEAQGGFPYQPAGGDTPARVTNRPETFTPVIHKTDSEGKPLSGAKFLLQAVSGDGAEDICYLKETKEGVHVLPEPQNDGDKALFPAGYGKITDYFTYKIWEVNSGEPVLYYSGAYDYQICEIEAPDGYSVDPGKYLIDKEEALLAGTVEISNGVNSTGDPIFRNDLLQGTLTIEKQLEAENREVLMPGRTQADFSGFRFLVSGFDAQGKPVEEIIEENQITGAGRVEWIPGRGICVTTAQSGRIVFSGVKAGTYQVAELDSAQTEAGGRYQRETAAQKVEIKKEGDGVSAAKVTFLNRLKRGGIVGKKVEAPVTDDSVGLPGAVMGLFGENETEFTAENAYLGMTAVSGADGIFRFDDVPYGTYLTAEITAPEGYYLNTDTSYKVTLASENEREGMEVIKDPVTLERSESSEPSAIRIGDEKQPESKPDGSGSHGGHGHGGSNSGKPSGGGSKDPSGPGKELEETLPLVPGETLPADTELSAETEGSGEPDLPEGDYVISTPQGREVYRGKERPGKQIKSALPKGDYLEYLDIGEAPVPLARFRVAEGGMLLELPMTGEETARHTLIWLMLGGGAALLLIYRKRKQKKEP